jgi:hypothetical protein
MAGLVMWGVILLVLFVVHFAIARAKVGRGKLEIIEGPLSRIERETLIVNNRGHREKNQSIRVGNMPVKFQSGFDDIEADPGDIVTVVVSKEANAYSGFALRNKTTGFVCKFPSGKCFLLGILTGALIFCANFLVIGFIMWWYPMFLFMMGRRADKALAMLPK